ncbi:hypothetical protein DFJ73DRAFT_766762 [Zopfochytrium polystomum]|nr:hypothetical protein DFJ73DRAFT_766762 [Zopfochytrium polystomum]
MAACKAKINSAVKGKKDAVWANQRECALLTVESANGDIIEDDLKTLKDYLPKLEPKLPEGDWKEAITILNQVTHVDPNASPSSFFCKTAFNYLESRVRLFIESYDIVEDEAMENKQQSYDSEGEYYDMEEEATKQKPWLPSVLVKALVSLLPALSARSMEVVRRAWEHICVLVFTAKASFPPEWVRDCVCASSDGIVFWKHDASQFIEHLRSVDMDGIAEDTLLQAIQEHAVNKSDVHAYCAFIVRQLRRLHHFCWVANLEHAPKIIAALADIGRTIGTLQFKASEQFRSAFMLAIDMVWLELLDYLCQNKLELHQQNLLEHCIPILVSRLNKQEGVGKLIGCLAPDMNDGELIEILDAILHILPHYSLETSIDPDIHKLGFPAVIDGWREYPLFGISDTPSQPNKVCGHGFAVEEKLRVPEIFTKTLAAASAERMASLINTKSASIVDVERLLFEALEHVQLEYHLQSGIFVMQVVRQLHRSVVGSPTVSPSITGSLLSLLAAYSSQLGEIHNPSEVPDKPEMASPELDFVTQMLAPASGLVYEEAVGSCLREVWVEATFCRSARFIMLKRSEEAGFGFRRVLSAEVVAAWKVALERKEEWYMEVSFGERNQTQLVSLQGECSNSIQVRGSRVSRYVSSLHFLRGAYPSFVSRLLASARPTRYRPQAFGEQQTSRDIRPAGS